jgi:hypothetical protein
MRFASRPVKSSFVIAFFVSSVSLFSIPVYTYPAHPLCIIFFRCPLSQKEIRVSSHIQRMGGINALALSRDQQVILTVGQEKKVTYVSFCVCRWQY